MALAPDRLRNSPKTANACSTEPKCLMRPRRNGLNSSQALFSCARLSSVVGLCVT